MIGWCCILICRDFLPYNGYNHTIKFTFLGTVVSISHDKKQRWVALYRSSSWGIPCYIVCNQIIWVMWCIVNVFHYKFGDAFPWFSVTRWAALVVQHARWWWLGSTRPLISANWLGWNIIISQVRFASKRISKVEINWAYPYVCVLTGTKCFLSYSFRD